MFVTPPSTTAFHQMRCGGEGRTRVKMAIEDKFGVFETLCRISFRSYPYTFSKIPGGGDGDGGGGGGSGSGSEAQKSTVVH